MKGMHGFRHRDIGVSARLSRELDLALLAKENSHFWARTPVGGDSVPRIIE